MKTQKIIIVFLALMASISFTSCVEDGDFSVPQALGSEENAAVEKIKQDLNAGSLQEISISNLKDLFINGQTVQITSDIVVRGFVSSSDGTGNFFREIFLQDSPENPTDAIKVVLDLNDTYNKFNVGREVFILLRDLYIGETRSGDGVIAIGGLPNPEGDEVENMTVNQIQEKMFRSGTTETIVPLQLPISAISSNHIGMFIEIQNAHFPANIQGKTYVDPNDSFDTQRTIQSCEGFGFSSFTLETSTFADFAFAVIPSGGGTIGGVVNKTFDGSQLVLVLNNITDVNMTGPICEPLDISEFPAVFEQDFENTSGSISIAGWTNYREAGSESWESYNDTNSDSRAARIGSFRSGDASTISWLITEGINLDATAQEFLSFETSNSFSDGSTLEVLISTDWDGSTGSITSATWLPLPGRIVENSENFRNWVSSGFIDLSSYSGTAYIAFKYVGSGDTDFDGTYELDNLVINAN